MMNKENPKNIQKLLLFYTVTLIIFMCIFLYLGGNILKNSHYMKIITIIFIILFAILACLLVGFSNSDENIIHNNSFLFDKETGAFIIHKNSESSESVIWYSTTEEAFQNVENNDTIYILDDDWKINEDLLLRNNEKLSFDVCSNIIKVKISSTEVSD